MVEQGVAFPVALLSFQVLLLALYGGYVNYDFDYSYKVKEANGQLKMKTHVAAGKEFYTSFQDVHVMIFIGFGFLMTFLKKYGFGAVSYNMLLSCVTIQWATLINAWIKQRVEKEENPSVYPKDNITLAPFDVSGIRIGFNEIMTADFAAAAVLITFGALIGKTTRLQLFIVCVFEVVFYAINENIVVHFVKVRDTGGSLVVHEFGAYFGLAISAVIRNHGNEHPSEGSNYHSDLFSMIGTVFLWIFWPSFNSGPVSNQPDLQRIAIVNTYFSLCACVVVAFAMSSLVEKRFRLNMVHIQNATIAGGVAVGTSADLLIKPWGAILIGSLAAVLSVVGFAYITPFMRKRLNIHDTCGVHNLHGMPAVLAGTCASIAAASIKTAGAANLYDEVKNGNRSFGEQGGYQFVAVLVSFAIAVVGGLITGAVIKPLNRPQGDLFDDEPEWLVPDPSNDVSAPLIEEEAMTKYGTVDEESHH